MIIRGTDIEYGDTVIVTMTTGEKFQGTFWEYETAEDSMSGKEEIGLHDTVPYRTLYVPEISTIEKVA